MLDVSIRGPEWCPGGDHGRHVKPKPNGRRPSRARCPTCKKRFTPRTVDYEPLSPNTASKYGELGEPGFVIPPHKWPKKKRKQIRAATAGLARDRSGTAD